jgi:glucose/arabinose dehydrogenase
MKHIGIAALLGVILIRPASGHIPGPLWAIVPVGFTDAVHVSGLTGPVAMEFAPDGRLFVCQKNGELRIVDAAGTLLAAPFVTLSVDTANERGLLGVAFDPQFAANGYLYCYYTVPGTPPHNRVSRFTANGNAVVPGSEVPILDLENLTTGFHNGGALHFGPDGKLYVAVGENGLQNNAQSIANRLGKILRINSDGTIPNDNPTSFPGIPGTTSGAMRAIWCAGLRNPFSFAFQPVTGRMFINDVGNATWEEVNDGLAGSNYGWPTTEGDFSSSTWPNFRRPLHVYMHDGTGLDPALGECIVGSAFYPSTGPFPSAYRGMYYYADLTNGWIRMMDPATNATSLFASSIGQPLALAAGPDGALYYLMYSTGRIGRISYPVTGTPPAITTPPASLTVGTGQSATFSVSASGSAPLSYQWQRNGIDLAGATATDYTLASAQPADSGSLFRCVVTNALGSATSTAATLTVSANRAPSASITAPATYTGGDTIAYSGVATDPEDGSLAGASFTWRVDFHHGTHFHPFLPDTTGATGGTFAIPTVGESSANVWYRITLTVRDSGGLASTVLHDLLPITADVTLETNPPGLQVALDGTPQATPTTFTGVVGMTRSLGAVTPQTLNGTTYTFASWSDGGADVHDVSTPSVARTYTATFQASPAVPPADGGGSGGTCGLLGAEVLLALALLRRR